MDIYQNQLELIEMDCSYIDLTETNTCTSCHLVQFVVFHIPETGRFDEIRAPKIGNDGRQRTFHFYFPVSNARHDKEFFCGESKKKKTFSQNS